MSESKTDENGNEYWEVELTDDNGNVVVQRIY
jgi:hypothetical protein